MSKHSGGLERCRAELAICRAYPEDHPESLGITMAYCDWRAEISMILAEEAEDETLP
jgi:hypothetical protein